MTSLIIFILSLFSRSMPNDTGYKENKHVHTVVHTDKGNPITGSMPEQEIITANKTNLNK